MRVFSTHLLFCFILLVTAGFTVPKLTGPVVDNAGLISRNDQVAIDQLLRMAHDRGRIQFQILTVTSLEGEPIEQASIQVTDAWKLGSAKEDNGVLLMVARDDRKVRIEVGQGLEGVIPDAYANRIIHDTIVPLFKSGEYSQGLYAGALQILRLADPELADQVGNLHHEQYQQHRKQGRLPVSPLWIFLVFIFLLIISPTFRGLILGMLLFSRGSRGWGGGGFSRGSGGFGGGGWSGGGGGFSGGGASGSW